MATVTLTVGHFQLATDLSDEVTFPINAISSVEASVSGSVETSVTGRRRFITRPGVSNELSFTIVFMTLTDLEWFRSNTNKTLLYRGPKGRKHYGFIPALSLNDTPGPTDKTRNVSFTFIDITKDDAV